jgi:hypothetical protein
VEGQGFRDLLSPWDRLPGRAEAVVRKEVWDLSRQPVGILVRFVTDATAIWARWKVKNQRFAGPTNTAVGSSGLDLYVKTGDHQWRWLGIGQPTEFPVNTKKLIDNIKPGRREYALYLPMHNPVEELALGVASTAKLEPAPARTAKPIVFYGTSITHGSSASRRYESRRHPGPPLRPPGGKPRLRR